MIDDPDLERKYLDYVKLFTRWPDKDGIRDRRGCYFINGLFIDVCEDSTLKNYGYKLPYTLRTRDYEGTDIKGNIIIYKSLYQIYMDSRDEYQFAMRAFNSYQQFNLLLNYDWFIEGRSKKAFAGINGWREEKEARDKSVNLKRITELADMGNVQSIKLLEERYKDTKPKEKGTPQEKQRALKESEEVKGYLDRAKLRLVKNNAEKDEILKRLDPKSA